MSESLGQPVLSGSESGPLQVPLERLEAQICELAGHLTAATCRFLVMVGDFDARRGWESWDLPSCSAWLSWKCQLSPGTAREQVRVARALRDLPVIRSEFAAGRLSYAKVRALTRIATPATERDLAELAGPMTGAQLDRFARAHRRVSRADDQSAREARRVTWRVDEHDGSVAMTVLLPAVPGQVVIQALRAAAHDLDHPHHGHHDDGPGAGDGSRAAGPASGPASPGDGSARAGQVDNPGDARPPAGEPTCPGGGASVGARGAAPEAMPGAQGLADALTGIAADYLAGKISAADNPDVYQVIIHVSPDALTAGDDPPSAADAPAKAPAAASSPGASRPLAISDPPAQTDAPAEACTTRPAPTCLPSAGPPATGNPPVTSDTPPAPAGAPALAPATAQAPAVGGPEDGCRAGCPYRRIGHPAHPDRCHLEDGLAISFTAAQRIACTATISAMLHDHDGTLLDIGRRHRKPTPALRRAVRERDRYRCAFPGCQSRRTDLHHIRHWARGGTTSYDNLISLCEAHHVIVHERGYFIIAGERGGFVFTRPDGTPMPASPTLPEPAGGDITTRHDAAITPDTIQGAAGERMNLHLTIWAAFANARIDRERATHAADL